MKKDDAVVVRRFEYSRSSMVLVLASRRRGLLRVLAKGVRGSRSKNRMPVPPELFSAGELLYYPRRSGLGLFSEWYEYQSSAEIGRSLRKFYAASFVCELAGELSQPGVSESGTLYALLRDGLAGIARCSEDSLSLLLPAIHLKMLSLAGFTPVFGRCVGCRKPVPEKSRALFFPLEGGVLCRQCRKDTRGKERQPRRRMQASPEETARYVEPLPLPRETRLLARRLLSCEDFDSPSKDRHASARRQLADILLAFTACSLERELRTARAAHRIATSAGKAEGTQATPPRSGILAGRGRYKGGLLGKTRKDEG